MASAVYSTPTPSQFASARTHLEQREEWRTVRIDGTRYVVLVSGNSGRTYFVRTDAAACGCIWYQQTGQQCSHMLALELAALEDELEQEYVVGSASLKAMREMYPPCAGGCGSILEQSNLLFCEDCSAKRAKEERLAAARRRVVEERG